MSDSKIMVSLNIKKNQLKKCKVLSIYQDFQNMSVIKNF